MCFVEIDLGFFLNPQNQKLFLIISVFIEHLTVVVVLPFFTVSRYVFGGDELIT